MMTARVAVVLMVSLLVASACGKKKEDGDGKAKTAERAGSDGVAAKSEGLGAKSGGVPTSREGQMYLLGQKLAQAAMVNGRAAPDVVARTFKSANTISDITLKQQLAPLPAVTGNRAEDGAAGMGYLLNGQGKELGAKIKTDFGEASAATYELAVKINMLPMLYIDDPKDTMGDTMAEVFGRLATRANLPETALGPIIAKLKARAPIAEVTDMALDLNKTLPVAIAAVYEKDDAKK
ncbi:MAG: hypothetical protein H0T89_09530 [Deltaproteobacteria bacterium]|nr:hypothetical protein [Deltaproteobacteria bacterium]MDQ3364366.1 hypothetical protein [Myxococcota bacterium]